jgi:hypothetical protein
MVFARHWNEHATTRLYACKHFCFWAIGTITQAHGESRYDVLAISAKAYTSPADADQHIKCCIEKIAKENA